MAKIIDARGLALPEPVALIKDVLEKDGQAEILVNSRKILKGIRRFAKIEKYPICHEKIARGTFKVIVKRSEMDYTKSIDDSKSASSEPTVAVLSSDKMGQGDDELGTSLMKAFIHTLLEISPAPETVILYNSGVKLAVKDTQTAEDLQTLIDNGSTVLLCGTCVNFYNLSDSIATGNISNMQNIASTIFRAGRIVSP